MSIQEDRDSLAQHPLFRTLVLMGGSLALGCGGVARAEVHATENGGAFPGPATSTSSAGVSTASGGSAGTSILLGQGGAITSGGNSASGGGSPSGGDTTYTNAGVLAGEACPYAQWDCSQIAPACSRDGSLGTAWLGCFCDRTRPLDANACAANESLFCLQGFGLSEITPDTWDYSSHLQCSCAKTPPANDYQALSDACSQLFGAPEGRAIAAYLPGSMTCQDNVCSATSADVLRQEGIMCGCADIGLK